MTTTMTSTKLLNLDTNKITLTKNQKFYNINYEGKKLFVQLKGIKCPFGVSDYNGNKKFTTTLSVEDDIKTKLDELKNKLINEVLSNEELSRDIKLKNLSVEKLDSIFNDVYKDKSDGKYKPLMKINFNNDYNDAYKLKCCLIVNKKNLGNVLPVEQFTQEISTMSDLDLILTPLFYCINGKNIGVSFKAFAVKVHPRKTQHSLTECLFSDEE